MKTKEENFLMKIIFALVKVINFLKIKKIFTHIKSNNIYKNILLAYFFSALVLMIIFNPSNYYNTNFTSLKLTNITIYITIIITIYVYICFGHSIKKFLTDIFYMNYSERARKEALDDLDKQKRLSFFHALLIIIIGFFNFHTLKVVNNISSTFQAIEERDIYFDREITYVKSNSYYLLLKPVNRISDQFDMKLSTDSDTYSNISVNKTIKLNFRKGIFGYVVLDMSKIYNIYNVSKYW